MTAAVNRDPVTYVLTLDELNSIYARFAHIVPVDGSRTGHKFDLMRAEWEAMGYPAQLTVTISTVVL